jgi:hypothetical protein
MLGRLLSGEGTMKVEGGIQGRDRYLSSKSFYMRENFSPPSRDFPLDPVDRKRGRCQEAKKRSVQKIWAQTVKGFTLDAPRFWKPQGQAGQNDLPTPHPIV